MQTNFFSSRRRDILLLVFSILGVLVLAGGGIYQLIQGITLFTAASKTDSTSSFFGAFCMLLCAILLLPSLVYSIRRLKGQEIPASNLTPVKGWQVGVLLVAWGLVIVLGLIINNLPNFGWLAALPFFLLELAIPVAGLVWIAIGGLPTGSLRRLWAAFGIGMAGSTLVAMLLEGLLVGIAALAVGIVLVLNPAWLAFLQQLKTQIANGGNVQSLLSTLTPYLTNPLVLLLVLVFASILAPIIEETLKPAAVWLLGKRLRSPAEGFALGALCGAGFALLEGMLASSGSFQMLGAGLAARATSSLMHIMTTGLTGWGIASARLEKRYGRLAWTYLLSISIHGLWNGSVFLLVFGALRFTLLGANSDLLGILFVIAGIGILISLLLAIMVLLPLMNHRLRPVPSVTVTSKTGDIIAPPQS